MQTGGLREDGAVCAIAVRGKVQRPHAAGLLVHHGADDDVAGRPYATTDDRLHRHNHGRQATFHVYGATAVDAPVTTQSGKRIDRPACARWHYIHVARQQQGTSSARTRECGRLVGAVGEVAAGIIAGAACIRRQVIGVWLPTLDLRPQRCHAPGNDLLYCGLAARRHPAKVWIDARDTDHFLEEANNLLLVRLNPALHLRVLRIAAAHAASSFINWAA